MPKKGISRRTREELARAIGERYRAGGRAEKLRILDEFVAVTGYHRKHAIRLLNRAGALRPARKASRSRIYNDAVREALVVLWEASDLLCGKRLKPLVPILVPALERHGHLQLEEEVRSKVLSASAASIEEYREEYRATHDAQTKAERRFLGHPRKAGCGKHRGVQCLRDLPPRPLWEDVSV